MKRIILLLCVFCNQVTAQNLFEIEQQIKLSAFQIVNGESYAERIAADSSFTKGLVRALKTPYSFSHKFDSFEWHLFDDNFFHLQIKVAK